MKIVRLELLSKQRNKQYIQLVVPQSRRQLPFPQLVSRKMVNWVLQIDCMQLYLSTFWAEQRV